MTPGEHQSASPASGKYPLSLRSWGSWPSRDPFALGVRRDLQFRFAGYAPGRDVLARFGWHIAAAQGSGLGDVEEKRRVLA